MSASATPKSTASNGDRSPTGQFVPGTKAAGRKPGEPNKITRDAREFMRGLISDPEYQKGVRERIMSGLAPHLEKWLWERFVGKPKEHLEITTSTTLFVLKAEPSVLPFIPAEAKVLSEGERADA